MYVSASTGNNDERQHVQCSEAHVCLKTCICLNWYPTVLFSYGRLLHDSGAMVKRSYIFCVLKALNIVLSPKALKLLLGLPACAMTLHLSHKNWPIRCGITWIYHIYSEDQCWLPSGEHGKLCGRGYQHLSSHMYRHSISHYTMSLFADDVFQQLFPLLVSWEHIYTFSLLL